MSRGTASLLQPFDLWGQRGWAGQEVAGESHYAKEIRGLFGTEYDSAGCELMLTVQLVPEPSNKHDSNAVSVQFNGTTVGYLPREDAARYVQVLSALVAEGRIPQVTARVWGGDRPTYGYDRRGRPVEGTEFVGSVRLDLAEPHMLVPANLPPSGTYALLPRGNAIQVTGEESRMNGLLMWRRAHRVACTLARSGTMMPAKLTATARTDRIIDMRRERVLKSLNWLSGSWDAVPRGRPATGRRR